MLNLACMSDDSYHCNYWGRIAGKNSNFNCLLYLHCLHKPCHETSLVRSHLHLGPRLSTSEIAEISQNLLLMWGASLVYLRVTDLQAAHNNLQTHFIFCVMVQNVFVHFSCHFGGNQLLVDGPLASDWHKTMNARTGASWKLRCMLTEVLKPSQMGGRRGKKSEEGIVDDGFICGRKTAKRI